MTFADDWALKNIYLSIYLPVVIWDYCLSVVIWDCFLPVVIWDCCLHACCAYVTFADDWALKNHLFIYLSACCDMGLLPECLLCLYDLRG